MDETPTPSIRRASQSCLTEPAEQQAKHNNDLLDVTFPTSPDFTLQTCHTHMFNATRWAPI